jgi:hypothetical protein
VPQFGLAAMVELCDLLLQVVGRGQTRSSWCQPHTSIAMIRKSRRQESPEANPFQDSMPT